MQAVCISCLRRAQTLISWDEQTDTNIYTWGNPWNCPYERSQMVYTSTTEERLDKPFHPQGLSGGCHPPSLHAWLYPSLPRLPANAGIQGRAEGELWNVESGGYLVGGIRVFILHVISYFFSSIWKNKKGSKFVPVILVSKIWTI